MYVISVSCYYIVVSKLFTAAAAAVAETMENKWNKYNKMYMRNLENCAPFPPTNCRVGNKNKFDGWWKKNRRKNYVQKWEYFHNHLSASALATVCIHKHFIEEWNCEITY